MDKKKIAIIIAAIVILLGIYQFVYVPYQNEEAIKHYNEGLQNVSQIDKELNDSYNQLNAANTDVSAGVDKTIQLMKDSQPKIDQQIEKLNETKAYANGNKTKEQYIDYILQAKETQKEYTPIMIQEYEKFNDAYKKMDVNEMMNISLEMENTYNTEVDKMITVQDNIINLLKENPDFNQTLHELNLTEDYYGEGNLTKISS